MWLCGKGTIPIKRGERYVQPSQTTSLFLWRLYLWGTSAISFLSWSNRFLHFPGGMQSTSTDFQHILKGSYKEDRGSLCTGSDIEKTQGSRYRRDFIGKKFHLSIRKKFFTMRTFTGSTSSGTCRVPITGSFQDAIEQGARQSHLDSLSHESLDHTIFRGPFQSGLFYHFFVSIPSVFQRLIGVSSLINKLSWLLFM